MRATSSSFALVLVGGLTCHSRRTESCDPSVDLLGLDARFTGIVARQGETGPPCAAACYLRCAAMASRFVEAAGTALGAVISPRADSRNQAEIVTSAALPKADRAASGEEIMEAAGTEAKNARIC